MCRVTTRMVEVRPAQPAVHERRYVIELDQAEADELLTLLDQSHLPLSLDRLACALDHAGAMLTNVRVR